MVENIDLKLKQIVENIEHLETEKSEISDQISAVYKESEILGFDSKIIRKIVALRKKDTETINEEEDLLQSYKSALGMI